MNKISNFFRTSALLCGSLLLAGTMLTSCGDDDKPNVGGDDDNEKNEAIDLDYSKANADSWHNYSVRVAELLARDSKDLYEAWTLSYEGGKAFAEIFRNPSSTGTYKSYTDCVDQIIEGCMDIAGEVGDAKIGEPYTLYMDGKKTEALYAVESWYSWHSREDYQNNIFSIRNSYYGTLNGTVAPASLSSLVKEVNPDLDATMVAAIDGAAEAIENIPQPFRNNINSKETVAAMEACSDLNDVLEKQLLPLVNGLDDSYDGKLKALVENYVDNVVLPTYKSLMDSNEALLTAVKNLATNRTDAGFKAASEAWLDARAPWETSEAFLFGPVDALGLDPNMDSWPLDQVAIANHIKSGNFSDLIWGDGDDDGKVEAAQNVRGFHTLEYLLFKDGQARKANN